MPKHVPQRTCIGCRAVRPKRELLRIVRTPEGEILFDPSGRRAGRGAYLCPSASCLDR
ncbi:MAG: YlxR family protein, partial [Symbiobacteriaceae bacterium]